MAAFTREEIAEAFEHWNTLVDRRDFVAMSEQFTEDGFAGNNVEGIFHGRPGILEFMSHFPLEWGNACEWAAIDPPRLVYKWKHWFPGTRPDGTLYEFFGIAEMIYAGNGLWRSFVSLYDVFGFEKVSKEWAAEQGGEHDKQKAFHHGRSQTNR